MDSVAELTALAQEALLLSLVVSLPVVAIAGLVGLVVAIFQAATQVQDFTLAHLPRLVVATLALVVTGPWIGGQIASFAARVFAGG
jgi:type III secretion HrpO family protein